jgi:hypothetical protein
MRRRFALLFFAAAVLGCGTHRQVCGLSPRLPKKFVTVADGKYEFDVPASLKPVAAGKYMFVHGGASWEDEHTVVSIVYGSWGEESFGTGKGCSTTAGGHPVFVVIQPHNVLVWHQTSPKATRST